jgi:hypothetical protein
MKLAPKTKASALLQIIPAVPFLGEKVLAFIRSRGSYGATDRETEAALNMLASTVTPRRGELVTAGLVKDSGQRRQTPSGRAAVVWVAVDIAPNREGGLFDE